jgi:hypothetical protein
LRGPASRRVRELVTWGRHLRQPPISPCRLGHGARRHYRLVAAVVTTRLAQRCCCFARTALPQGSHWLAPLRLVDVNMPRVCHTRHAWRRRLVVAAWGRGGGLYPARMLAKLACDRAAFALDCGRTVAGARYQDAVQTIDYRLTGISEPCGCRCRGDQSGSCARSREHRAMR